MNLLFTGRSKSGSWQIRGEQLGFALGATVKQPITVADCKAVDMIVVVKRATEEILSTIRASGKPWVFDCLDFYPQPSVYSWSADQAIDWVQSRLKSYAPSGIIWPTQWMQADCDVGIPGLVLPHHHRPGIGSNPIRPHVQTVGYEGATAYLGHWRNAIEAECGKRGWTFVVNPEHLADLDIVVALRDPSGYVQRHWKSNVKLANAHGSGTPFVGQPECGYLETASGAEYWADNRRELAMCFDWLDAQSTREQVSDRFRQKAFPLERAAGTLRMFLDRISGSSNGGVAKRPTVIDGAEYSDPEQRRNYASDPALHRAMPGSNALGRGSGGT